MTFRFVSEQTIRSPSQGALARYWDQLAGGRRLPAFSEFVPDPAIHDPRQLVVWNIEGHGRLQKFRALYQGENVADAFNSAWAGKTMEQVVPMSLRRVTLDAATECAASGCPVYMVLSTWDAHDTRIDCERLLLPFGSAGKVEQLLGSLQLTNVPNSARRKRAVGHFEIHTEIIVSGRIKPGFALPKIEAAVEQGANAPTGRSSADNRRAARRNIWLAARVSFAHNSITCMVRDISATGASIEASDIAAIPDIFKMRVEMESAERRCAVVWRKKTRIGIEFR